MNNIATIMVNVVCIVFAGIVCIGFTKGVVIQTTVPGRTTVSVAPLPPQCYNIPLIPGVLDSCRKLGGGFKHGTPLHDVIPFYPISDIYIVCFEGALYRMICRRCAESNTVYNPSCNQCLRPGEECPPPSVTSAPAQTKPVVNCVSRQSTYCENLSDGPHPLEDDEGNVILSNTFFICSNRITYCMRCPVVLVYDYTCYACNWPYLAQRNMDKIP